jgi:hypothetical protein
VYAADQLKKPGAIFAPEAECEDQLITGKILLQLEQIRLHIFIQPDLDRAGSLIQIRLLDPPEEGILIIVNTDPDTFIADFLHGALQIRIITSGGVIYAADLTEISDRELIELELFIVWGDLADQIQDDLLLLE